MTMTLFGTTPRLHRSADISYCGRYRWSLRRSWVNYDSQGQHTPGKGVCCFVMLNPSTADSTQDDPTIRRCIGFAKRWGFNILSVRNLFPWRATDPDDLVRSEKVADIFGGNRGDQELLAACTADMVVAAWGASVPFGRDRYAMELFAKHFSGVKIYCLGKTKGGSPRHPLYVRADTDPQQF